MANPDWLQQLQPTSNLPPGLFNQTPLPRPSSQTLAPLISAFTQRQMQTGMNDQGQPQMSPVTELSNQLTPAEQTLGVRQGSQPSGSYERQTAWDQNWYASLPNNEYQHPFISNDPKHMVDVGVGTLLKYHGQGADPDAITAFRQTAQQALQQAASMAHQQGRMYTTVDYWNDLSNYWQEIQDQISQAKKQPQQTSTTGTQPTIGGYVPTAAGYTDPATGNVISTADYNQAVQQTKQKSNKKMTEVKAY
jgi:hypothetical protein